MTHSLLLVLLLAGNVVFAQKNYSEEAPKPFSEISSYIVFNQTQGPGERVTQTDSQLDQTVVVKKTSFVECIPGASKEKPQLIEVECTMGPAVKGAVRNYVSNGYFTIPLITDLRNPQDYFLRKVSAYVECTETKFLKEKKRPEYRCVPTLFTER